jgi:hypothetical protein
MRPRSSGLGLGSDVIVMDFCVWPVPISVARCLLILLWTFALDFSRCRLISSRRISFCPRPAKQRPSWRNGGKAMRFISSIIPSVASEIQSLSACCLRGPWPGSVPGQGARGWSVSYLAVLLQVLEMCFTFSMVSVSWGFAEVPAAGSLSLRELPAFEVDPVIRTSCPTCLLRVELAPCSR